MRMELVQKQTSKITQSMIQQLIILQMTTQQLTQHMQEIALENPLVELEEPNWESSGEEYLRKLEWMASTDEQNRHYYCQDYEDRDFLNLARPAEETLTDALKSQLMLRQYPKSQLRILNYIIDSLDKHGYFRDDIDSTAKHLRVSTEELTACLEILKGFEPAGVCAVSLQECLLLQLERMETGGELDVEKKIVHDYLKLLGKNQLHVIAKKLKVKTSRVILAKERILQLNPKPSAGFSDRESSRYVTPDVTVVKIYEGYHIHVNNDSYPALRVNHEYMNLLKNEDCNDQIRHYLSEKLRQIEQTQSCIARRNSTLMELAEFIVQWQNDFFCLGKGHLRPLRMRDAAQALGLSESTISRAVDEKYLQCSWGIFPMDYFFSKGVYDEYRGETISTDQIYSRMKQIVDEENKKKPLSDQQIASELEKQGVHISRRTVAKYRESIGIQECRSRKDY